MKKADLIKLIKSKEFLYLLNSCKIEDIETINFDTDFTFENELTIRVSERLDKSCYKYDGDDETKVRYLYNLAKQNQHHQAFCMPDWQWKSIVKEGNNKCVNTVKEES
jgi:hypothetical protein